MKFLEKERLSAQSRFYLSLLVCVNLRPLSFIIGNTDIDFLSSHLPTSPPIAPVPGLVSVGTEMTVACEIPLNLFAISLILTFILQLIRLKILCRELLISCDTLLLS